MIAIISNAKVVGIEIAGLRLLKVLSKTVSKVASEGSITIQVKLVYGGEIVGGYMFSPPRAEGCLKY
jgi:hypothetical protein